MLSFVSQCLDGEELVARTDLTIADLDFDLVNMFFIEMGVKIAAIDRNYVFQTHLYEIVASAYYWFLSIDFGFVNSKGFFEIGSDPHIVLIFLPFFGVLLFSVGTLAFHDTFSEVEVFSFYIKLLYSKSLLFSCRS